MKITRLHAFLILFILGSFLVSCEKEEIKTTAKPPVVEDPKEKIVSANWETTVLSEAVVWKYFHFDDLFYSNQSITVFDIDLNKSIKVDIPYVTSGFLKTSEGAVNSGGLVAINGSYFNTADGGSTVFFKKDGSIINETRSGFTPYRENAGFSISSEGMVSVIKKPAQGWASVTEASTLLASGPLLVFNGEMVDQVQQSFNTNRHPRTAIGVTDDNHLIAVVVDGRATEAHGMTTEELSIVMDALGCKEAMNLDGGGSSTAYVRNKGVVNYPSDNNQWDHEGERGVATVISFIPVQ